MDTAVNTINVLTNDTLVDNAVISSFDNFGTNGGSITDNGDGTFHYVPMAGYVGVDSFTYTLTDDDMESSTAMVTVTITSIDNPSGVDSDDFNGSSLDTSLWTVVSPVGDTMVSITGTQLSIAVPGGVEHSIWDKGNLASRVMQDVANADFDVVAKFDLQLDGRYQSQGILVEQSAGQYIRFDFYQDKSGVNMRIAAASIINGVPLQRIKSDIASGAPQYLRVNRIGNQWTQYYSYDGVSWIAAGSFEHILAVNSLGVFAANNDRKGTAYTVLVDSFGEFQ